MKECWNDGWITDIVLEDWPQQIRHMEVGDLEFAAFKLARIHAQLLRSCTSLCDPMDCSPLGSSVHGILQARMREWVAISFSRGSSQPRDRTHITYISCIGSLFLYH